MGTPCTTQRTAADFFPTIPMPLEILPREVRGAQIWAKQAIVFARGARFTQPVLVDGAVGVVVAPRGRLFRVLHFTFVRGKIAEINVVGDPERLRQFDLAVLHD